MNFFSTHNFLFPPNIYFPQFICCNSHKATLKKRWKKIKAVLLLLLLAQLYFDKTLANTSSY